MTLTDTVKKFGAAVEARLMTRAEAEAALLAAEDGITAEGAADLIATWREQPRKP